jgi:hypothetical protein
VPSRNTFAAFDQKTTTGVDPSIFSNLAPQSELRGQESGANRLFLEIRQGGVHKSRSAKRLRVADRPACAKTRGEGAERLPTMAHEILGCGA